MAKVTLPYTIVNGAANDGVPVQGNFNALLAGINTIDTEQLNGPIVGLANLMSTVKVIESVTHTELAVTTALTITETTMITQNVTLSAQRYCLFLINAMADGIRSTAGTLRGILRLYDGTSIIQEMQFIGYTNNDWLLFPLNSVTYKQITSGAHTFYIKAYQVDASSSDLYGGYQTSLTTIVFAF